MRRRRSSARARRARPIVVARPMNDNGRKYVPLNEAASDPSAPYLLDEARRAYAERMGVSVATLRQREREW